MNFNRGLEGIKQNIDYEESIYNLIEDERNAILLGKKEVEEISNKISGIENEEDAEKILKQVKNRLKYLSTPFMDYDDSESVFENNINKETKTETRKKIEKIVAMCKDGELDSIGKGYTAEVFQSKACPKCCYKVIHDLEEYKKGCTIQQEALIQDVLCDLGVEGVTVPKPYYYRMAPDSHVMVMESLDVFTIKDIAEGKNRLPENFDLEKSISALKEFVKKMHSMGIHHRDLHDKNIVIFKETGEFGVIDFGKAKTGCEKNLENAYRNEDEIYIEEKNGEEIRYKPTDLEYIEIHHKKLKEIIYYNKE